MSEQDLRSSGEVGEATCQAQMEESKLNSLFFAFVASPFSLSSLFKPHFPLLRRVSIGLVDRLPKRQCGLLDLGFLPT